MPRIPGIWKGRAIGAVGSSVPVVGDIGVLSVINKFKGTPIGIGARQGLKFVGGPVAVLSWSYTGYEVGSALWDMRDTSSQPTFLGNKESRGLQTRSLTSRVGRFNPGPRSRGPSAIPRRGKRCPPGYRYDAKRKMCIQTFKR